MYAYLDQYEGHCPFFGRVRGFRFVRRNDSLRFTVVGSYIGRDQEPFRRPCAELIIGHRTVESIFGWGRIPLLLLIRVALRSAP